MSKIYFVMPAYNEAVNIEKTVRQWYPVVEKISVTGKDTAKLIIANDGSKDETYPLLMGLVCKYPLLEPLNKPNTGHGATVLYLYHYAIDNNCDYVFQTDSDGQTNPDEFWHMWECREKYDLQIGFRKNRQDGITRILVTKVLRLLVWMMFHEWIIDANSPFRLMQAEKLKQIINVIPQDYFLCNVAVSAISQRWNYKIGWHIISFKPRQGGVNSINVKRIFKIGWKAIGDFRVINNMINKR